MSTTLTASDIEGIIHYVGRRLRNLPADRETVLPVLGATAFDPGTDPPAAALLQLARTAIDICANYASAAPYRILIEASIRTAGWMRDADPGVASRSVTDGTDTEPRPALSGALRGSGAQAQLAPYRIRRLAPVTEACP